MKPICFASRSISQWILTAAILPVLALSASAWAQYRVGEDGHAGDASNRIGSGGYNINNTFNSSNSNTGASPDQIFTGHSTGLSYFHGPVGTRDPNVIGANSATRLMDRFQAVSAPVDYSQRNTGQSLYQPFYSSNTLAVQPPAGTFQTTPGGGGLIPARPYVSNPADTRLGITNFHQLQTDNTPRPGEFDMPGPVDTSGYPSVMTASALYGIRPWNFNDPADQYFISQYTNLKPQSAADRLKLDNSSLQRMRLELQNVLPDNSAETDSTNKGDGTGATAPRAGGAFGDQLPSARIGAAAESPQNPRMNNSVVVSDINPGALPANGSNGQAVRQRVLVSPINPGEQSTQLADLQRRWQDLQKQGQNQNLSDQDSTRIYNQQVRLQQQATVEQNRGKQSMTPSGNTPGQPGNADNPSATPFSVPGPGTRPANLQSNNNTSLPPVLGGAIPQDVRQAPVISSLATGVKAKGLADLLASAEESMRQGRFSGALDGYDAADQVSPGNPLVMLGRAMAELGASYYGRADADLRAAVSSSPALLVGRYDLRGFLGQDRLNFVTRDLQEIDAKQRKSPLAPFLLAFIAHNTGDDNKAASYLDRLESLPGTDAKLLKEIRQDWGLNAGK